MKFFSPGTLALCLLVSLSIPQESIAQKGKSTSGAQAALTVTKTNIRRVPGLSPQQPLAEVSFEVTWHSKTPPSSFYYRNAKSEWLDCNATRPERRTFGGGPNDFMLVYMSVRLPEIKAGDHFNLTAERHTHEVMPSEVRNMPADALYYQIGKSEKWHVLKVNVPKLPH